MEQSVIVLNKTSSLTTTLHQGGAMVNIYKQLENNVYSETGI